MRSCDDLADCRLSLPRQIEAQQGGTNHTPARLRSSHMAQVAAGGTVIDSNRPLAEAAQAHARLEAGLKVGKILLLPGEAVR